MARAEGGLFLGGGGGGVFFFFLGGDAGRGLLPRSFKKRKKERALTEFQTPKFFCYEFRARGDTRPGQVHDDTYMVRYWGLAVKGYDGLLGWTKTRTRVGTCVPKYGDIHTSHCILKDI